MNEDLFESYPEILEVTNISRILSVSKAKITNLSITSKSKVF